MPRRGNLIEKSVATSAVTNLVTTTETVIATLPGISTDGPNQPINLIGVAQVKFGTATTAVLLRIRRGTTIAGPVVAGPFNQSGVAASVYSVEAAGIDNVEGELASQPYVLTAQQEAATGNGEVAQATLSASF